MWTSPRQASQRPTPWRAWLKPPLHRLGVWLTGRTAPATPRKAHALTELVGRTVHARAQFGEARVPQVPPGAAVHLGADSILCGRLMFHRPGVFRLGPRSYVGPGTELRITTAIDIGADVMISWGCTLIDTDMHSLCFEERAQDVLIEGGRAGPGVAKDWSNVRCAPIRIGDRVWIGMRVIVLPGVSLGDGCVIGAGSVVTRDVPAWSLAAGNPARVVRSLPRTTPPDRRSVAAGVAASGAGDGVGW